MKQTLALATYPNERLCSEALSDSIHQRRGEGLGLLSGLEKKSESEESVIQKPGTRLRKRMPSWETKPLPCLCYAQVLSLGFSVIRIYSEPAMPETALIFVWPNSPDGAPRVQMPGEAGGAEVRRCPLKQSLKLTPKVPTAKDDPHRVSPGVRELRLARF